jgi:hypothetical protein
VGSLAHVVQWPKTFCGNEGVLECSGLTELGVGSERANGKSKAVSSHRSPRKKDPQSHAETGDGWVGVSRGDAEGWGLSAAVTQEVLWP